MPLFWLSLGFLLGLSLAGLDLPWWLWLGLAIVFSGLVVLELRLRKLPARLVHARCWLRVPISLVIVFIMLGGLRGALDAPRWTERDVGWYVNRSEVRLSGVVVDLVDIRPASTRVRVRMDRVAADVLGAWEPVHGTVLVTFPAGTIFSCGDRLELQGSPTLPVEEPDFSYRAHLDRQGIHAVLEYPWLTDQPGRELRTPASLLCLVRQAADGVVVRILPQPESAILAGVVLGMDRDLPAGLVEAFRRTGTSHLLVVSGFNVTLIAGLVLGLLSRRLSPFRAALLAALAVLLYTLLVGADPPVLRAAIMALLGLGGNLLGRRQAGLNSLTLAAAVMALFEPGLLADPGFQLSFTATLGLIVYGTPFQDAFLKWTEKIPLPWLRKGTGLVVEYLATTLAAQLATLPVIAYHFHNISLSALLTNLLVLPVQPLLMILGGAAVLLGILWLPLGQAAGLLALPLAGFTVRVVEWIAGWSTPLSLEVSGWGVLIMYALLGGVTILWMRFPARRLRLAASTLLVVGALMVGVAWRGVLTAPDGSLHLTLFDFSNAAPLLVQSPAGNSILINSTADTASLTDALGRRLPLFHRSLAAVWISDRRESNLTSLFDVVERYPVKEVRWSASAPRGAAGTRMTRWLAERGVEQAGYSSNEISVVDETLHLKVLLDRETQTVLLLKAAGFTALLPGSAPPDLLLNLRGGELVGVSLLILTPADLEHHSPEDWEALQPAVVLVSAPIPQAAPANWVSTLEHGWVTVIYQDGKIWLEGER